MQCCSLAQRGPTKAECRTAVSAGFCLGCNAPSRSEVLQWQNVGPRFPRDLVWDCNAVPSQSEVLQRQNVGLRFPRDLVWECNAVPSRSEVLQRQNVGPRFPRDFVWGAMLPRAARSYSGLLLQEYAIPMAILTNMVNDFRSFRVGYNVPCCFDRFFIRAHSPVIEITLPLN